MVDRGSAADATKEYFRRPATVHTWWDPERAGDPLFGHFLEQRTWLTAQASWRGAAVLDIGTGRGRLALAYAACGGRVVAIDIALEMLGEARRHTAAADLAVSLAQGDGENLPFASTSFEVVSCIEAIMHFPDPLAALKEMSRVVKPDGLVLLSMTNTLRLRALLRWPDRALARLRRGAPPQPRIFWTHSVRGFRRLLAAAGLAPVKAHGQGLLQATDVPLGHGRRLPVIPRFLADWAFAHLEPPLREGPLLALMGTVMFVCRRVDDRDA